MSGGSWDYLCHRVEEAAERLQLSRKPLRRAFGAHLQLCAKALHDIEWVDSSDYAAGDEVDAIRAALGKDATHAEREAVLVELRALIEQAQALAAAPPPQPGSGGGR